MTDKEETERVIRHLNIFTRPLYLTQRSSHKGYGWCLKTRLSVRRSEIQLILHLIGVEFSTHGRDISRKVPFTFHNLTNVFRQPHTNYEVNSLHLPLQSAHFIYPSNIISYGTIAYLTELRVCYLSILMSKTFIWRLLTEALSYCIRLSSSQITRCIQCRFIT